MHLAIAHTAPSPRARRRPCVYVYVFRTGTLQSTTHRKPQPAGQAWIVLPRARTARRVGSDIRMSRRCVASIHVPSAARHGTERRGGRVAVHGDDSTTSTNNNKF